MASTTKKAVYALRHPTVGFYLALAALHWPQRRKVIEEAFKRVLRATDPARRLRVVDLGCGPGKVGLVANRLGLEYVGVDSDPKWIDYCRLFRQQPDATFICSDASGGCITVGADDIVIMNGLIHHISDEEVQRVLGRLVNAHALIIEDHLRDYESRTRRLPRFMQSLDRGRYVRPAGFFRSLPGFVLESAAHYPIRLAGITVWELFTNVYHSDRR